MTTINAPEYWNAEYFELSNSREINIDTGIAAWPSKMSKDPPKYVAAKTCMIPMDVSNEDRVGNYTVDQVPAIESRNPITANLLFGICSCSFDIAVPYLIIGTI